MLGFILEYKEYIEGFSLLIDFVYFKFVFNMVEDVCLFMCFLEVKWGR